ncbi:MotE family protein [Pararhodobacter marinus]|uniref:MotE family protein n=1 Tax=Pararhodobacter marinus TaxID=2184063 RepID=UPI003512BDE6
MGRRTKAAPTATRRRPRRRAVRVLPLLALLFVAGGTLRLVPLVPEALARDPATEPATAQPVQAELPADPQRPLRTSPASDAELSLQIRERERQVAEREAQLEERAALMTAAEERLRAQIDALQSAESDLSATMALADRAAEDDIARLVAVFGSMKPEDAAAVFTEMDPDFAAGFLARLEPQSAADILAGMEPRLAYTLSAIVAGRNALVPRE